MTRKWCLMASVAALVMALAATAQAAVSYQLGPKAKKRPKIVVDFARWDQNGDGGIDHAEFQQGMKKLGQLLDRRRGQRGKEARQGRQGRRGPKAQRGRRAQRGPDARRGPRGPRVRQGRGPGREMVERIQAMVRKTVKQTLREMHKAGGPAHGGKGAFDVFGPGGPKHGPMHGQMRGPKRGAKQGAMWQGMQRGPGHGGPPHHAGLGGPSADGPRRGRGMGPMRGGPQKRGCPECGCQCGGKGGQGRGEFRKPGRRARRGAGPEARERGRRGDGSKAGRRGARGRKGDGPPPRLMEMFKRQDANGDGVVTADEFMGPPDRFEKLDANGDGAVDRKELKKVMKRGKKARTGKKARRGKKSRGRKAGRGHEEGRGREEEHGHEDGHGHESHDDGHK